MKLGGIKMYAPNIHMKLAADGEKIEGPPEPYWLLGRVTEGRSWAGNGEE
jgi:hypothetical protein